MDASVGLTFSLRLFQRYQRNGLLQATVRHVPGIPGACTAYIHLTAGSVTSCYVENKQGQRLPFAVEDLCRIDLERGPFEWIFHQQASSSRSQLAAEPPSAPAVDQDAAIPRIIAQIRWDQFNHWTLERKLLLQDVWQSIDGRRSVREIKAGLAYPPQAVNDILQFLLASRVIVLAS